MRQLLKRFGIDNFILALFAAVVAAWLYPDFGARKGFFSLSTLANFCVSVIFFFYGLRLNWVKIRQGLSNVKMHVVVLLASFLYFPLLALAIMAALGTTPTTGEIVAFESSAVATDAHNNEESEGALANVDGDQSAEQSSVVSDDKILKTSIWLGVFFLAALPSTVSSSVVMTNIARGNVPAAIFDASASSLLGIFITPIWMRIFIDASTGGREFTATFITLLFQVLVPIIIGVALNRKFGETARKHEKWLGRSDQASIVLIVYVSFCNSFADGMFHGLSTKTLVVLTIGLVALFFLVYFSVYGVCKLLSFNREDKIATLFCGTKKSLVHGVTIARAIVGSPAMVGALILPTMIYHAMQLIVVSAIARHFAQTAPDAVSSETQS